MRKGDIDRFFLEVSKKNGVSVSVYITGGIASWLMGGDRPTQDIDFGLKTPKNKWSEVEALFQETSQRLGLPIQFSENISRWSLIEIPHYEKKSIFYKKFGKVSVFLLDPISWSIGKVSRYYQSDVDDLRVVFKKKKPKIEEVIQGWSKALRTSPKSSDQFLFLKTAEDFLKNYGKEIWGKSFDTEAHLKRLKSH